MSNNYCPKCGQPLDSHLLEGSHSLIMGIYCGHFGTVVDPSDIIKRIYALELIVFSEDNDKEESDE